MKGMQKIKRGKTFNGLISYLLKPASHHKSDPYVVGGNVIESFAEALSAEFNATKLLRSDVCKPVWHNSLRLPAGECLPIQRWKLFAYIVPEFLH
ncbi:relaxase [Escherichia coli]|nr:relaxase [Escherichia coli]GDQ56821.1 relaxase [Escherichia coli]